MTGRHHRPEEEEEEQEGQGHYHLGPWLVLTLIVLTIACIAIFIASHLDEWIVVE